VQKLEEQTGGRTESCIHPSGPNTKGERSKEDAGNGAQRSDSEWREKSHNSERENCAEERDQKLVQDRSVKCFYTNANSVVSKMDELRERVKGCSVVEITESWATNNISDAELHIEGMTMFQSDR